MSWVEALAVYGSYFLCVITFPFSLAVCAKIVNEYEQIIIFRLGLVHPGATISAGIYFILPCIDDFYIVDTRAIGISVPRQEVLTKDFVTLYMEAIVWFVVKDPISAIVKVDDYCRATHLLAMAMLRHAVGTKTMTEALSDRESIAETAEAILDRSTRPWGIRVTDVTIENVALPEHLQEVMAIEAEAAREAKARVIAAEGEKNASRSLRQAADMLSKNPRTLQLRYLQTLNSIATESESTIMFPFPMEVMDPFRQN